MLHLKRMLGTSTMRTRPLSQSIPQRSLSATVFVQVSRLRLAWLERVWNTYRTLYGTDIPVDIWNIHTYVGREMHRQWGFEIPPGIPNAAGYSVYYGTQWSIANDAGASGGTVHKSRTHPQTLGSRFMGTR